METILSSLLSFLLLYKYVGLFCVAFLSALALPLPAGSILAAAGAFAAQGYFDIRIVLLVALVGNVLADMLSHIFIRHYGLHLLKKIGFEYTLTTRLYKKLESHIWNFSPSLIFLADF